MKSFTAQMQDFEDLCLQGMKYVAVESIQDVMEAAQTPQVGMTRGNPSFVEGKIPVGITSELINSLTSEGNQGPASYQVALAGFDIGDYLEFKWTAPHAMRMEVGFVGEDKLGRKYNMPGRHFVGKNAARFSEFVYKHAMEARNG